MKNLISFVILIAFYGLEEAIGQWQSNGSHIYNTNAGNVGIGNTSPVKLLMVGQNMSEPTITVRNFGGIGGATFQMWDDASGADWKFKATNSGGFKIRDNALGLDVITLESNSFANAIYIKSTDNIGIGTATPASSALVDMSSSSKGFLPPRMTATQIEAIQNPADGLLVYCSTDKKLYIYNESESTWNSLSSGSGGGIIPGFTCGDSITIAHVAGYVAPVNKTVTYYTDTVSWYNPDQCWILSNLGADHQAAAVNDATEASAGWYWQFNQKQGYKHDGTTRTPSTTMINVIYENSNWQSANDPCSIELGGGWRLPTYTEYFDLDDLGGWGNWNGPWGNPLKIHLAGRVDASDGLLHNRGLSGYYWSSSQNDSSYGQILFFNSSSCYVNTYGKPCALSIRCLRDM